MSSAQSNRYRRAPRQRRPSNHRQIVKPMLRQESLRGVHTEPPAQSMSRPAQQGPATRKGAAGARDDATCAKRKEAREGNMPRRGSSGARCAAARGSRPSAVERARGRRSLFDGFPGDAAGALRRCRAPAPRRRRAPARSGGPKRKRGPQGNSPCGPSRRI